MSNKNSLFILYFILKIIFIYSSSDAPVYNFEIWTPESLYNYVSKSHLNRGNPNFHSNIKHMIIDPEQYLDTENLNEAYQYMQYLYEEYIISSHIFFISHIDNKYKMKEEISDFVSKLSYLLYRNYDEYDEKRTLTVLFAIKDRRMRIRTTKKLRKILSDNECLDILNSRKNDLINENYQQVVNGLMRDIFITYKILFKNKSSSFKDNIIIIFIIAIIILLLYILINKVLNRTTKQEDKVKNFLDKLKKKYYPKTIFTESCIICLEEFQSNDITKEYEKSGDTKNFEKEETSILECGHKFHRKCISNWLKKEANCPICRMKFDIKGNNNNSNKQNSRINISFDNILSGILRIQIETNSLNNRQTNRIRRDIYYHPRDSSYSSFLNNIKSFFKECFSSSDNDYDFDYGKYSSSSHRESYFSFNEDSGGASSSW